MLDQAGVQRQPRLAEPEVQHGLAPLQTVVDPLIEIQVRGQPDRGISDHEGCRCGGRQPLVGEVDGHGHAAPLARWAEAAPAVPHRRFAIMP